MSKPKFVRVQEKGQITLPAEFRRKLGVKKGDFVAVVVTEEGVLITPQEVLASRSLARMGEILREQGLDLDELIASGRDQRVRIIEEKYGIRDPE